MKRFITPILFTVLSLAGSTAFGYCANEEFLTTPSPNTEGVIRSTTVNSDAGKISSIIVDGKAFQVIRSKQGTITGFADDTGKVTPIAEIKEVATNGKRGVISEVLEPCQQGGDYVVLDVAMLPTVEITRDRAGDTYFWKDITQITYPDVPEVVGLGPDPDRVKACKPSFDLCMSQADKNLPLFFPACLKASEFVKTKRPSWGAAIYTAIIVACGAAAEWMKEQNENSCRNSFADCSAGS